MSNIIVQGNEINAKQYVEKITIEGIGEEKSLNIKIIVAKGNGPGPDPHIPIDLSHIEIIDGGCGNSNGNSTRCCCRRLMRSMKQRTMT